MTSSLLSFHYCWSFQSGFIGELRVRKVRNSPRLLIGGNILRCLFIVRLVRNVGVLIFSVWSVYFRVINLLWGSGKIFFRVKRTNQWLHLKSSLVSWFWVIRVPVYMVSENQDVMSHENLITSWILNSRRHKVNINISTCFTGCCHLVRVSWGRILLLRWCLEEHVWCWMPTRLRSGLFWWKCFLRFELSCSESLINSSQTGGGCSRTVRWCRREPCFLFFVENLFCQILWIWIWVFEDLFHC